MKLILRFATALLPLSLLLTCCTPVFASSIDENAPDAQALAQLELRAQQAGPRDQCFLYTELVHTMTELAGRQMLNGDIDQASNTLKKVNRYAQLIHMDMASNSKRLKNAEMLMHHTTHRLTDMLHVVSNDDRAVMQSTLKRLNTVQSELLSQVFVH